MADHPAEHGRNLLTRAVVLLTLGIIVFVGAFLRLYRLEELVLYLGDQGRDMMVVSHMVSSGAPVLLGPGSGFGQFQRGPAYYYLLVAGWASGGGNPAGAAAALAVLDVGTILLLYVAGRLIGGPGAGLVAAALYATSGAVIGLARAFLNPNVLPFFSILVFVSLALLLKNKSNFLPLLVGTLVVAWQMHDQTWLLALWAGGVLVFFRPSLTRRALALSIVVALVALAPFLVYELQNDFANLRAILAFVLAAFMGTTTNIGGVSLPQRLVASLNITQGMLPAEGALHFLIVGALVASAMLLVAQAWRTRERMRTLLALYALLPLMYLIWPGPLYASYLAILAPVPFLVLAFGAGQLMSLSRSLRVVTGGGVALVCIASAVGYVSALQNAVPAPESLGAARAGVEYMLARASFRPFLWRLEKQDPITHELQLPWRYLLEWSGASPATDMQADSFAVYMPATYAPVELSAAPLIAGNRIAHFRVPTPGADAVRGGVFDSADDLEAWNMRRTPQGEINWDAADRALRLQGDALTGELMAVQRFNTLPVTDYAVEFEYRNSLSRGSQRVYFLCLDVERNFLALAPQPGGYELEPSAEWRRDLLWVRTPPNCVRAILWLRQEGNGTSRFRNVSVRPLTWAQNDGQFK